MVFAAFGHILSPEFYAEMTPSFLPENISDILAFVVELAIRIGLFIPRFRSLSGLALMILMLIFLPSIYGMRQKKTQPSALELQLMCG